jgi:mannose-6-phosphate isomerase-like protein (cupin superfamily)
MTKVWRGNINKLTEKNPYFRKVLFTGNEQLVLMSLKVREEIGNEVHQDTDQFFRIEKGTLKFIVDNGNNFTAKSGDAVIIPAKTWHNVINVGSIPAKFYSVYAPPTHPAGTVDRTKQDAIKRGD